MNIKLTLFTNTFFTIFFFNVFFSCRNTRTHHVRIYNI